MLSRQQGVWQTLSTLAAMMGRAHPSSNDGAYSRHGGNHPGFILYTIAAGFILYTTVDSESGLDDPSDFSPRGDVR